MITEAYIKNGIVAIAHFRREGKVYGHTQREGEEFIFWPYLFQMDEDAFTESVSGAESYDVRRLPALYRPIPPRRTPAIVLSLPLEEEGG